jgi:hypothetical protein
MKGELAVRPARTGWLLRLNILASAGDFTLRLMAIKRWGNYLAA